MTTPTTTSPNQIRERERELELGERERIRTAAVKNVNFSSAEEAARPTLNAKSRLAGLARLVFTPSLAPSFSSPRSSDEVLSLVGDIR